jgi:hypothetical protein
MKWLVELVIPKNFRYDNKYSRLETDGYLTLDVPDSREPLFSLRENGIYMSSDPEMEGEIYTINKDGEKEGIGYPLIKFKKIKEIP